MRDILVTAILVGLIPRCFTRPHVGVLTWSWVGYMNPHRLCWGFAVGLPAAQMVALPTLLGLALGKEPKKIPWAPVTYVLALFIGWTTVTSFFAINSDDVWAQWGEFVKVQVMVFVTLMVMRTRERLHALVWIIVISIGFFGVKGGLFTLAGGGQGLLGPPGSFIGGNTEIGLAMTMVLPLMWYLRSHTQNKNIRRALLPAMALTTIAILGSHSRGAFLAIIAMGALLWWKSRNKAAVALAALVLVPAGFLLMPQEWHDRMASIGNYQEDKSAMGRINAWGFALNAAKDRPLVGLGFDGFTPQAFQIWAPDPDNWHDAHSVYFEILGEQGYVGLFLFLLILWLSWRNAGVVMRRARGDPEWSWAYDLAAMIQVSLIAYMVGGAFLGLGYWDMPYTLAAIVLLLRRLVEQAKVPKGAVVHRRPVAPTPDEVAALASPGRT